VNRQELVEIAVRGIVANRSKGIVGHADSDWDFAEAVIDAIEPVIRAEEQARALEFCCADTEPDIRRALTEEIATYVASWHKIYDPAGSGDVAHWCMDAREHDMLNDIEAEIRRIGGIDG
jgi:hypothetical protein